MRLPLIRLLIVLPAAAYFSETIALAEEIVARTIQEVPPIRSSWEDLLKGVETPDAWQGARRISSILRGFCRVL